MFSTHCFVALAGVFHSLHVPGSVAAGGSTPSGVCSTPWRCRFFVGHVMRQVRGSCDSEPDEVSFERLHDCPRLKNGVVVLRLHWMELGGAHFLTTALIVVSANGRRGFGLCRLQL